MSKTYEYSTTGDGQQRLVVKEPGWLTREVTECKDGSIRVDDHFANGTKESGPGVAGWSGALSTVVRIGKY